MKKIIILLAVLLITGCTGIQNNSFEVLLYKAANSNLEIYNTFRKGYKYYLPAGMYVQKSKDNNEVIKSKTNTFYMFIDLISYLEKTPLEYARNGDTYYFSHLSANDKSGYVAIKITQDKKYLVEIAYNYAKIEVMVEEKELNHALSEAMIILSSIEYKDSFLKNLSDESLLNFKEETVDIFKKGSTSDSNKQLQYIEDYDGTEENKIPDYDLIK